MASSFVTCVPTRTATSLQVNIPGAGVLRSVKQTADEVPSPASLAMTMLGQLSPALAPFMAIMKIVDVIAAIKKTFDEVKPPFSGLPDAILALVKKIGGLAEFLPGLTYVITIRDMIALTSTTLRGIAELMNRWVTETQGISDALQASSILQDPELSFSATCANNRLFEVRLATQASIQDIGQLLKVIKLILDIVKSAVPIEIKELNTLPDAVNLIITQLVPEDSSTINVDTSEISQIINVMLEIASILDQIVAKVSLIVG